MANDLDIHCEILNAKLGVVKVHQLDQLKFDDLEVYGTKSLDQKNITNLLHRFSREGCRRLDPLTWIHAEVSPDELHNLSGLNRLQALSPIHPVEIKLERDWQIRCLQGKHRVIAAKQWLDPSDLWWNVLLYDSTKLTASTRRQLREADSYSREFGDGEIFRNVRHYQLRRDDEAAGEWLARWTPTKCRDFSQIYKIPSNMGLQDSNTYDRLRTELDALLEYPALWHSWHMGTHLSSLRCPEELANYLHHIRDIWDRITCHQPKLIEQETVEILQGRCPYISEADRRHVKNAFDQNMVFSCVTDPQDRSHLQNAVFQCPWLIRSLKLFLEDTKYLKPLVYVMKKLLPRNFKGTIRQAIRRYYVAPPDRKALIQTSDSNHVTEICGDSNLQFLSAYYQVFLFTMRHFYGLLDVRPLGHSRYSQPRQASEHQDLWRSFKAFVCGTGFSIPGIQVQSSSLERTPEFKAVHSLLTRLRPSSRFEYDQLALTNWSARVTEALLQMKEKQIGTAPVPSLTTDTKEAWSLDKRSGMTDISSFYWDQKYLFFRNVYCTRMVGSGENPSTFAVKANMFRCFFPSLDQEVNSAMNDNSREKQCPGGLAPSMQSQAPMPQTASGDMNMHNGSLGAATDSQAPYQQSQDQGTSGDIDMNRRSGPVSISDQDLHQQSQSQGANGDMDMDGASALVPRSGQTSNQQPQNQGTTGGTGMCNGRLVAAADNQVSCQEPQSDQQLMLSYTNPSPIAIEPLNSSATGADIGQDSGDSVLKVQTIDYCIWDMNIEPARLVKELNDASDRYPYATLCNIPERKLYCFLPSGVKCFSHLLDGWGNVWFAKITDAKGKMPKPVTHEEVATGIGQSEGPFFFRKTGIFKSYLEPLPINTCTSDIIDLPYYHADQRRWVMEEQRGVEL
ncbi:hypothetical protein BDV25DRAFT_141744 [Aspergillus avenaceus]|uniref:Uncharacterized protein n=1 Tax=Aspergillus avenaceus TaxID=36643 RepID=A0A5N6TQD5_ASPAV|nr:hypothetical protein BDV25DRAFT_141744 [Aspergillus avenaceus]